MGDASLPYTGTNGAVLRAAIAYLVGGFATFLAMGLLGLPCASTRPGSW
jgi:hypothetical protein